MIDWKKRNKPVLPTEPKIGRQERVGLALDHLLHSLRMQDPGLWLSAGCTGTLLEKADEKTCDQCVLYAEAAVTDPVLWVARYYCLTHLESALEDLG